MVNLLGKGYGKGASCAGGPVVRNVLASARGARDMGSIPGLGRSPGIGNGRVLQYSCLENSVAQRSLEGYSPWRCKELEMTVHAHSSTCAGSHTGAHAHTHTHTQSKGRSNI